MKRPRLIWTAFAVCTALGLGVLGWFTREMLRFDRLAAASQGLAAREEAVRLALWRMDSALSSLQGLEAARPSQDYEAFHALDSAWSRNLTPLPDRSVWVASPLVQSTPAFVRLNFRVDETGAVTSPQAPPTGMRATALAAGASLERISQADADLTRLASRLSPARLFALGAANVFEGDEEPRVRDKYEAVASDAAPQASTAEALPAQGQTAAVAEGTPPVIAPELMKQRAKNLTEDLKRKELYVTQNRISASSRRLDEGASFADAAEASSGGRISSISNASPSAARAPSRESSTRKDAVNPSAALSSSLDGYRQAEPTLAEEREADVASIAAPSAASGTAAGFTGSVGGTSALRSIWAAGELFFIRETRSLAGGRIVEGAWLDWPEIEAWLLGRIADLLPEARLLPVRTREADERPPESNVDSNGARRLAFLPVDLIPGPLAQPDGKTRSLLRTSLGAAWISALLGTSALGLLLHGTVRLSERRGAFVSAVTHELRTPLTTFRIYTEMLSNGMVTDEARRQTYVDTLRSESERLAHLVDNVLSYSRIERGRAASRVEETTPAALVARMEERLRERLRQAGMTLALEIDPAIAHRTLRTDTTGVEQVLFNLVDNAAKYGRPSADSAQPGNAIVTVSLASRGGDALAFRVTDRGPGLPPGALKRLFQPFSKSAHEAAESQPGVGLGLALCRRLARKELGGGLVLERSGPEGSVFRLDLPWR